MTVRSILTMMMLAALPAFGGTQEPDQGSTTNRPQTIASDPAQPGKADQAPASQPGRGGEAVGLWPSPKLMRLVLIRWADELSARYELDEDQKGRVRELVVKRWQPFLDEHRDDIQPLVNEFLEMRLGLEPPTADQVRSWGERATPTLAEFRRQLDGGAEQFREILTPQQRTKFELDMLAYRAGAEFLDVKLQDWRRGEYEAGEVWSAPGERRRRRARRRAARVLAADQDPSDAGRSTEEMGKKIAIGEPPDQIALEVDAWTKYVENFSRVFELEIAQTTSVVSVLDELRQRALAHRDRHREEIAALERRIAEFSGDNEALEALREELTKLYGPVDEMFQELKQRVETVPTAGQRAAAARKEDGARGSSASKPKSSTGDSRRPGGGKKPASEPDKSQPKK